MHTVDNRNYKLKNLNNLFDGASLVLFFVVVLFVVRLSGGTLL
jgi:hypothetical protein